MNVTVFYSWQSDRLSEICRSFIQDAANIALQSLGSSSNIEPSPRLVSDTKDEAGMPEVATAILEKIQRAGFFLADVTFVGSTSSGSKLLPNPNVVLELGYAARAIGWERIICVMNEAFGAPEKLIFDLRHRRWPITYTLHDTANRSVVLSELSHKIKEAVSVLMWAEHNRVADAVARLDAPCLMFLKINSTTDIITPPPTNRVIIGAPLDTAAYQHAVARLLDVGLIECSIAQPTGHSYTDGLTLVFSRFKSWDCEKQPNAAPAGMLTCTCMQAQEVSRRAPDPRQSAPEPWWWDPWRSCARMGDGRSGLLPRPIAAFSGSFRGSSQFRQSGVISSPHQRVPRLGRTPSGALLPSRVLREQTQAVGRLANASCQFLRQLSNSS
jgi:hypothetical protein